MWIIISISVFIVILYFQGKGVPIFLYHQVNRYSNISPEIFEEHLKILKNKGMKTLTISEFYENKVLKNTCLLTFDDGYYDNYKVVFPLLKKYNMKATIFLNTLYIKDKRECEVESLPNYQVNYTAMEQFIQCGDAKNDQYMSWEEIKEMKNSGLVDFQAHSHKHTAIFVNDRLEGVLKGNEKDITDLYLYEEICEGYPKFRKRGEYASKAIIIDREFFKVFKKFYEKNLKGKSEKEIIKVGQKFVDNNKKQYFHYETEEEFGDRITEDFQTNKKLIEEKIQGEVQFFCWPWGHRNKNTIKLLKTLGIKGFVTTKKGTNYVNPNLEKIRRIELRKFTPFKFRINLFIARNYILGKIYEIVS